MRLMTAGYPQTDPFHLFKTVAGCANPDDLRIGDVLLLWGGEDIGTQMYGQRPNMRTHADKPSKRDLLEVEMIKEATRLDIPIIGICRGAQLLTIATGGTLIQHADGHGRSHKILCYDTGKTLPVNSCHHQICQPVTPAEIVAIATEPTTGLDEHNNVIKIEEVPEIIHFPQIRALGIQFHPEWTDCPQETVKYLADIIVEYILQPNEGKEAA